MIFPWGNLRHNSGMASGQDFSITVLKGNIADLEEAAEQLKERRMTDKIGPMQSKLEKAEKMIEEGLAC